jgi:IclR family transcriptional regulator, KDG regulon repressor
MEKTKGPKKATPASDVPAVDRTLDILECLSRHTEGLTLSELSVQLELPKNAVFRISAALQARGYVTREDVSRKFFLTSKFLTVTQPRFEKKSLVELALPGMRKLRDATKETVQIGVLSGMEGVILDQLEGLYPLRISVDSGLRFKLYNNAPGKLLLAHMPQPERDTAIKSMELTPCTPRTITSRPELTRECERILSNGHSLDHAEADEGIHCIAAPVLNKLGQCAAALWISGPSRRMPRDTFSALAAHVMEAARDISTCLRAER